MKFLFAILSFFSASFALADSWPLPSDMASASPNSKFVVRVVPPKLDSGKDPVATLYTFDGVNYAESSSFSLKNKVSPVFILITNNGNLFTFDNWHELGYGEHVVAIYSPNGELKKTYTLDQLYSNDDYKKVIKNRSVSSIWWRCSSSQPWTHYDLVFVRDTIGGSFTFNDDGSFSYKNEDGCEKR